LLADIDIPKPATGHRERRRWPGLSSPASRVIQPWRKFIEWGGGFLYFVGMRILLVEDERKAASFIERGLREEGFAVEVARDGEEGLFLAQCKDYDLLVLDVLLPKMDGFQLLRELRRSGGQVRVLMLTARDSVADRVRGLDEGADDYLIKPFAFSEFLARVRALLRRQFNHAPTNLQFADLMMDLKTRRVTRGEQRINLTPKESAVLEYLMRHAGEVVTRTALAEHVWDVNFDSFSNVIDVTVYHLREKIDRVGQVSLIHTARGAGYVLKNPE
jgi:two-component system, OmpR family, copper resistance phosphate regulon response regulator CusR